jgi:hypothetical protein
MRPDDPRLRPIAQHDEVSLVRVGAQQRLAGAEPGLIDDLRSDPDPEVRAYAYAIAWQEGRVEEAAIHELLRERTGSVFRATLTTAVFLDRLALPEAHSARPFVLHRALSSSDWDLLLSLARDPDREVARAALLRLARECRHRLGRRDPRSDRIRDAMADFVMARNPLLEDWRVESDFVEDWWPLLTDEMKLSLADAALNASQKPLPKWALALASDRLSRPDPPAAR